VQEEFHGMQVRHSPAMPPRKEVARQQPSPATHGPGCEDGVDGGASSEGWWQRARQLVGAAGGAGAGLTASAAGVSLLTHPLLSSTADPRVQIAAGLGIAAVTLVGGAAGAVLGWNLLKREA